MRLVHVCRATSYLNMRPWCLCHVLLRRRVTIRCAAVPTVLRGLHILACSVFLTYAFSSHSHALILPGLRQHQWQQGYGQTIWQVACTADAGSHPSAASGACEAGKGLVQHTTSGGHTGARPGLQEQPHQGGSCRGHWRDCARRGCACCRQGQT